MTFEELKEKISTLTPDEILGDRIYQEIIVAGEALEDDREKLTDALIRRAAELDIPTDGLPNDFVWDKLDEIEDADGPFLLGFEPFSPFWGFGGLGANGSFEKMHFPLDALPPFLARYTLAVAENIQVSPDMVAPAVLGVIAICTQGKFRINPKAGWILSLNLYIAIAAKPSERKSPMLEAITKPLYEYERTENEKREPEIKIYESKRNVLVKAVKNLSDRAAGIRGKPVPIEEVIDKQRELTELEKSAPHFLRLIADDATMEVLAKLLANNNERLAVVSSEGGGILGIAAGKYTDGKGANIDLLLKAYSGEPVAVDRIMRDAIRLNHPLLTILLTIQPLLLEEFMSDARFRGRGLIARFLLSVPSSVVGHRKYESDSISTPIEEDYRNLIAALFDLPEDDRIIQLTDEADRESESFHYQLEPRLVDDLEPIEDWAGKYHGQVMRIAGLLHVCDFKDKAANFPLELETMKAAERIGEYFLKQAQAIYGSMDFVEDQTTKYAKYILRRLDEYGENSITKRELHQLCKDKKGLETSEKQEPALKLLVDRGYIRMEDAAPTSGKGGRRSTLIFRNLLSY
ncbi:MAG: YfjI family protein [Acutalibacteraceae bacterium]